MTYDAAFWGNKHPDQSSRSFWKLRSGSEVNTAIAQLPVATKQPIACMRNGNFGWIPQKYAILSQADNAVEHYSKVVGIVSDRYNLVQHQEAFRPIIEGLTIGGVKDFTFSMWNTPEKASMAVYVANARDGVKFGFKCSNSYDGKEKIRFSVKARSVTESVQIVEKQHVLVWGLRQVCSNGMVVKVPLKVCKYMDAEKVMHIRDLFTHFESIAHVGETHSKLQSLQFLVEGMIQLEAPLNMMIIDAQNKSLSKLEAMQLLGKYITKRRMDTYMNLYGREEQTLWGLYNAVTFFASHKTDKIMARERETLLMRAGDMLTEELLAKTA